MNMTEARRTLDELKKLVEKAQDTAANARTSEFIRAYNKLWRKMAEHVITHQMTTLVDKINEVSGSGPGVQKHEFRKVLEKFAKGTQVNSFINPDGMAVDDLVDMLHDLNPMTEEKASGLFPKKPRGYVLAAEGLVDYIKFKLEAMAARFNGDIQLALKYEQVLDRIYDSLPKYARW